MIDIVSNNIVNYLEEQGYITEEKEIYLHGTKLLISYLTGTIIALSIAILTNTIIKFIIIIYMLIYLCMLNILYYINNQYVNMFIYTYIIINILTVGGVIDYEKHKE